MNYSKIKYNNIANGTGVRTSLFVSGCNLGCKGCFNREAWDKASGSPYTKSVEDDIINSLKLPHVAGLSLLGGEPFMSYNIPQLIQLCERVRYECPDKDIWVFSGLALTQITRVDTRLELLKLCDVLVDGKFDEDLKGAKLKFRGSSNQRIIEVGETLATGQVVLHSSHN